MDPTLILLRYVTVLCLLSVFHTAAAVSPVYGPFMYFGGSGDNTSAYVHGIEAVVTSLTFEASRSYYGTASVSGAYGLFICSSDASQPVCLSCVQQVVEGVAYKQPGGSYPDESFLWYDVCFLRYSNENFFGTFDNKDMSSWKTICTGRNSSVSEDSKIMGFLSGLADVASARATRFSSGVNSSMYGSAQCTGDISSVDCATCLRESVRAIGSICQERGGGMHLARSCSIRYLNASLVDLSKPPPGYPHPVRNPQLDAGGGYPRAAPTVWLRISVLVALLVAFVV